MYCIVYCDVLWYTVIYCIVYCIVPRTAKLPAYCFIQILSLHNVHLTPTLPPSTHPSHISHLRLPIWRARQELHDLESSMDNTGAMLKGASEMPHKSEPPDLEDVEEEAEVREAYRED